MKRSAVYLLAVVACLAFASTAAAEMRVGMATSPVDSAIPAESDILTGKAIYDSEAGSMVFSFTTAEAPEEESNTIVIAAMGQMSEGTCSYNSGQFTYPVSFVYASMYESSSTFGRDAIWSSVDEFTEAPDPEEFEPASNLGDGATTTLFATSTSRLTAQPFNCAVIATTEPGREVLKPATVDEVSFPISGPPPATMTEPAPTNNSGQSNPSPPPPAAAPGALSIQKAQTLSLQRDKWRKVSVKIANPGSGAVGPVSLTVAAPRGVILRFGSGKQTLPSLEPGGTWTVSYWVRVTEKAKARSIVSLTAGTKSGLSAKTELIVKASG